MCSFYEYTRCTLLTHDHCSNTVWLCTMHCGQWMFIGCENETTNGAYVVCYVLLVFDARAHIIHNSYKWQYSMVIVLLCSQTVADYIRISNNGNVKSEWNFIRLWHDLYMRCQIRTKFSYHQISFRRGISESEIRIICNCFRSEKGILNFILFSKHKYVSTSTQCSRLPSLTISS